MGEIGWIIRDSSSDGLPDFVKTQTRIVNSLSGEIIGDRS